ncbi:MAG: M1 family peptidase [Bacteroidetes bacterium]|nr:MAG: M1 family peptidase [Bacteroidota bacterium]
MRRYTILTALAFPFLVLSCKTKKGLSSEEQMQRYADSVAAAMAPEDADFNFDFDEITVNGDDNNEWDAPIVPVYKGSETRVNDILHTYLEISFDWKKKEAYGAVSLDIKPYFKSVSSLDLDAQFMDIHRVAEIKGKDTSDLSFDYDKKKLHIELGRSISRTEKYRIFIRYTAKPEEVVGEGGVAIQDIKGLYFIDADSASGKPAHFWTQGETQHNSCWVPTIDAPNEKFTHDIVMTVADSLVTASNGRLKGSKKLANGMRQDHWTMENPHSPYLMAMFAGKFHVVEAKWGKMPLRYIVDPKYAASAQTIFGNTPEMIDFYSKKLGYAYPWPKYDQVVVHDFISGAMENTGITVHGDMLMLDTRDLLDDSYEDVIAHELFHHWFGDLVTCESWANLPLNESFATYGEYLWKEFKYGKAEADYHLYSDRQNYFNEASGSAKNMIRYDYEKPDAMFDRHSYQKGGLLLHQLRTYLGDEAFFASLKLYLNRYAFQNTEIHQLRQCFEEISGEDLTWYFDQWFFHSGHPVLEVTHIYDEFSKEYAVEVKQTQEFEKGRLFHLPLKVAFHYGDSVHIENIHVKEQHKIFHFQLGQKPEWVSFDADKSIVGRMREEKDDSNWMNQLRLSPLYQDRFDALMHFDMQSDAEQLFVAINYGLTDSFWNIRSEAMGLISSLPYDMRNAFGERIIDNALHHPKSDVRSSAFYALRKMDFPDSKKCVEPGLNDSSYMVNAAALNLLFSLDTNAALAKSNEWAFSENNTLRYTALAILTNAPGNQIPIFTKLWNAKKKPDFFTVAMVIRYAQKSDDPAIVIDALDLINTYSPEGEDDYLIALFINQTNGRVKEKFERLISEADEQLAQTKDQTAIAELNALKLEYLRVIEHVVE